MSTSTGPSQTGGSSWLYDISLLENDSSNFQISTVLRLQGLIEIVDGTDKCPALVINTNKVANLLEINDWNLLQVILPHVLQMFASC